MADRHMGIRFNERPWDSGSPRVEVPSGIDMSSFLSGLTGYATLNDLATYVLGEISGGLGLSDPMMIAVDGENYLIRQLKNGELLADSAVDDRKRSLLKYVAKQKKPVNRFDFPKGRLLSGTRSNFEDIYAFCCIIPLCSLGRTSGYLFFNHPVSRTPVNDSTAAFFSQVMIPIGLALDVVLALDSNGKIDPETGLLQKNTFLDVFSQELRRSSLNGNPLTLCILEYPGFKEMCGLYGEEEVHKLEISAGTMLRKNTRGNDLVFRFGNGRFVLILPDTPKAIGEIVALRFKTNLAQLRPEWKLSLMTGLAGFPQDGDTTRGLYTEAERELK